VTSNKREEDQNLNEEEISEWLLRLPELNDLRELVGSLTPEEQSFFQEANLEREPSAEELRACGPDFTARVLDRMYERGELRTVVTSHRTPVSSVTPDAPSLTDCIALAELLAEAEIAALLRGEDGFGLEGELQDVIRSAVAVTVAGAQRMR